MLFQLENEARRTLTQIILGAFGLIALYLTWRRVEVSDQNLEAMRQGQITDRYTKAIEQLGKTENGQPNIEVRLGGIYALERIAIDSERDHHTIMEVLSAYVRRNSPRVFDHTLEGPIQLEIQAILSVLAKLYGMKRHPNDFELNLTSSDLKSAKLVRVDFQRIVMHNANLRRADLQHGNFQFAQMQGVDLRNAILFSTDFRHANLSYSNFQEADLIATKLQYSSLSGADLRAHLEAAELTHAHLTNANLEGAFLKGANLDHAWMDDANLKNANLEDASLEEVRLRNANLQGAKVKAVQLRTAHGLDTAIMDAGLRADIDKLGRRN